MSNQAIDPAQPAIKIAVKIPAPALSPVVIGFVVCLSEFPLPVPAFGSLVLLPPVSDVTGPSIPPKDTKFARKTFVALISCSIPVVPSHWSVYHLIPQVWLLFPVQVFAAACAEACNLGVIWAAVSGTSIPVNTSHDETRPLNRISLKLHCPVGSQVISSRTLPCGKKVLNVFFKRPSTGVFHFSAPLV
jgi:hypothetical protein